MSDVILLVEDRDDDVVFMKRAFAKAHVDCGLQTVRSARQAMSYLSGEDVYGDRSLYPLPRLVLLDLSLPDLPGFDVLRWIRRQSSTPDLIVIVLTSSELSADIQRAYDLGANSFLTKPADPAKLTDLIRDLVQHWLEGGADAGSTKRPDPGSRP